MLSQIDLIFFLARYYVLKNMVKRVRRSAPLRRRVRRRVRTVARVPRSLGGGSHFSLKQKTYAGIWEYSNASTAGFWKYWTASPIAMYGWAEHSVVFDEYKVNALLFEFYPSVSASDSVGASTATAQANFHYAVDPSSTVVPSGTQAIATLNSFMQQGDNIKTCPANKPVKIYYKPKIASQVFGGGLAGRLITAPWLKTTESSVDHRGFHAYINPSFGFASVPLLSYNIYITYYLQFRGSR